MHKGEAASSDMTFIPIFILHLFVQKLPAAEGNDRHTDVVICYAYISLQDMGNRLRQLKRLTRVRNRFTVFYKLHLKHPVIQRMFKYSSNHKRIFQLTLKHRSRVYTTLNTPNIT